MSRPETGAMRFAGDWRGVFIRGDNAFGYAMEIRAVLKGSPPLEFHKHALEGLLELLECSDERQEGVETQRMKPYEQCVAEPEST